MSEDLEVSDGEEGALEGCLSRGSGAADGFLCHFCVLLPKSTRFKEKGRSERVTLDCIQKPAVFGSSPQLFDPGAKGRESF